jgi:hypothetical protein
VAAHPFHREFEFLPVAALRYEVEVLIGAIQDVNAPRVAGVCVKDSASFILDIEGTDGSIHTQFGIPMNADGMVVVPSVPPLADDFLGTNETYAVKILSAPMSFDSLMGNLCLSPGVRSCFFPAAC